MTAPADGADLARAAAALGQPRGPRELPPPRVSAVRVDGVRDRFEDKVGETRRTIRDKRRELSRAVEEGRAAARDARHELERRLADAQRKPHDGAVPEPDATAE